MAQQHFPLARREGFVIHPLEGELLVFDGDATHLLNATAASVWQLCDSHHSVSDLSRELVLDEPAVLYALQQLDQKQLLQDRTPLPFGTMTRREFLKKSVIAAAAIPVVQTVRLPSPSQAGSCIPAGQCANTCGECCDACAPTGGCSPQIQCTVSRPP